MPTGTQSGRGTRRPATPRAALCRFRPASPIAACVFAAALLSLPIEPAAAQACGDWRAELVAVEGTVEVQSGTTGNLRAGRQGGSICRGDLIRVGPFGRAAIRLPDPDRTLIRIEQNSQLQLGRLEETEATLIDLIRGLLHIISRDPRSLSFATPYANAGLEGTEFTIGVADGRTEVTVIEGAVNMTHGDTRVDVTRGQQIRIDATGTAIVGTPQNVFERADWTPYYAPLNASRLPLPDAEANDEERRSADFFVARAESRLRNGAIAAARDDIERALDLAPRSATPEALLAVIALRQGDKQRAREHAERAFARSPDSVPALLAVAYVEQAEFDWDAAARTLERARILEPENALVLARLGELRLYRGQLQSAIVAAVEATELDPELGHAYAIIGFAALAEARYTQATDAFQQATTLDQASPLPRLGLALALLGQGRLDDGRKQLEIAVILDPTNALVRSYMAKVYAETDSAVLADTQLDLAAALDPDDATVHLYRGLGAQLDNLSVDALHELNTATALNDNRLAHRSQLRLDEDVAVRSASVGRVYRDLGFESLALAAGWRSTALDYLDAAGHRILADVYSTRARHELPRVYELFQSQLLLPTNLTPIPPQLGGPSAFPLDAAGPDELALSEYGSLIQQDGIRLLGSAVAAGNGTGGYDFELAGVNERLAYGFGHFDFGTDGFRPNNDLEQQVSNAFVQFRPRYETNLFAELRKAKIDKGDLRRVFDPTVYSPDLRQREDVDTLRLGIRRMLGNGATLLGAVNLEDTAIGIETGGGTFSIDQAREDAGVELLYHQKFDRSRLTSGLYHLQQDETDVTAGTISVPFPPFDLQVLETTHADVEQTVAYAYVDVDVTDKLVTTVGVNASRITREQRELRQAAPKLGLIYQVTPRTSLRAAAFRTLQGPLVSRHNVHPRLEPTHVSGYNQFFFGAEGDDVWRYGASVDHTFSESLFGGLELSRRDIEFESVIDFPDRPPELDVSNRDERVASAYLYWTPSRQLSLSATYERERTNVVGDSRVDGFTELRTHRLPLEVNYFHRGGLRVRARLTFVDQSGQFVDSGFGPTGPIMSAEDAFHVLDLSLGYRLPNRRGSVSLSVHNALDETFRFQDTDVENPGILPERLVALRFTLAY